MRKLTSSLSWAATVVAFTILAGCGGGGNGGQTVSSLTGVLTDVDGSPVAGGRVFIGGNQAISKSNGSWELYNVRPGYNRVQAFQDINGRRWSGETTVDASAGEHNRGINIMISDERFHGAIEGYVLDNLNRPVPEAKVFAGGPVASTMAVANSSGFYRLPALTPSVTYTVTASLAGYINHTRSLHVDANTATTADFRLVPGTPQGAIEAPQNVVAQAWTVSSIITRADTGTRDVYEMMKRHYRRLRGLPANPKNAARRTQSRVTPDGSLIEIDLFWDYQAFEDLFGYAVKRATRPQGLTDPNVETALLRDPLTSVFFDIDYLLTPDVTYYYTVHRLETIDFPPNGLMGPPSQIVNAAPLQPIYAERPLQASTITGNPVFQWSAASGVSLYRLYLWEEFPALLSDTDPNGTTSIWTTGNTTAGTTITYNGPPLLNGHTYYWMAVGETADNSALTATEIFKFRTPN